MDDAYYDVTSLDTLSTHQSELIKQQCEAQEFEPGKQAYLRSIFNLLEDASPSY